MAVGGQEWEAGFGYQTGGPSEVDPALLASDLTGSVDALHWSRPNWRNIKMHT